jgi:hypothetical protein
MYCFLLSFLGLTPEAAKRGAAASFRGLMQKSIGTAAVRDYNANIMCSRESCAVLPSRFIASLLIFLAAFLIGVATVGWL